MKPDGRLSIHSVDSVVRVAVARAVAEGLITGIDNAAEEGRALTQLQQIDLAAMGVLAAADAIHRAADAVRVESELLDLARRGRVEA